MSEHPAQATTGTEPDGAELRAVHALADRGLDHRLDAATRTLFEQRFNALPAMHHMGCVLAVDDTAVIRVEMPRVEPHHRGGMGTEAVNGAVLSGMADCALGVAGVLQFGAQRAGTVEMSIKFLRPAVGDAVVAYAIALKRGGAVVFTETELFCAGRRCALATGIVAQPTSAAGATF